MTNTTINAGDIVEVITDKCKFVAYYFGEKDCNGKIYKLVSPYQDDRPKHWLDLKTEAHPIIFNNNNNQKERDKFFGDLANECEADLW